MKKTSEKINSIMVKVKDFFKRINPFKKRIKINLTPVKTFLTKNKVLSIGVAVVIVAFVAGYFLKGLFIAATVNGQPISRIAVIKELELKGGASILETFITEDLIRQAAAKKGISVSQKDIDASIASISANLAAQSQDLDSALAAQGMTKADLVRQLTLQSMLEQLLADKVTVTDAEIDKYITDNKITLPGTNPASERNIIKQQIVQEKLGQEVQPYLTQLQAAAKIRYFVKY